ncbi:hypothetical protein Scep_028057 [Stephania cephalantha]|uniref:Uncharacterized protein n=1 Tax=Stephania cephalantha TaxID=152367 RepID=A0AAP0E937_9MAGN
MRKRRIGSSGGVSSRQQAAIAQTEVADRSARRHRPADAVLRGARRSRRGPRGRGRWPDGEREVDAAAKTSSGQQQRDRIRDDDGPWQPIDTCEKADQRSAWRWRAACGMAGSLRDRMVEMRSGGRRAAASSGMAAERSTGARSSDGATVCVAAAQCSVDATAMSARRRSGSNAGDEHAMALSDRSEA